MRLADVRNRSAAMPNKRAQSQSLLQELVSFSLPECQLYIRARSALCWWQMICLVDSVSLALWPSSNCSASPSALQHIRDEIAATSRPRLDRRGD